MRPLLLAVMASTGLVGCWTPREGAYVVYDVNYDRNECGFDSTNGIYETAVLALVRERGWNDDVDADVDDNDGLFDWDRNFQLLFSDTEWPGYVCEPDDVGGDTWEFACLGSEHQEDLADDSLDAGLTINHNIRSGRFDDQEYRMSGDFVIEADCSGRDCPSLADDLGVDAFPCTSQGTLGAAY